MKLFLTDEMEYEALLALPLNRSRLTTDWRGAYYIYNKTPSWRKVSLFVNSFNVQKGLFSYSAQNTDC